MKEAFLLGKIAKEKRKKEEESVIKIQLEQASEFHKFILIKKALKGLKDHQKKCLRKKLLER